MEIILGRLHQKNICLGNHRVVWARVMDGRFAVKRLYSALVGNGSKAFH